MTYIWFQERLARKIEMMGGIYQLHFVESVTHVVVHEALSIKYNVSEIVLFICCIYFRKLGCF